MTSLSRFQILEPHQANLPARCAVNGEFSEKLVDFGFFLEGYGNIYICLQCVRSMCNELGYLSPEQSEFLKKAISELQDVTHKLIEENRKLRDAVDTIRNLDLPIDIPNIPELPSVENMAEPEPDNTKHTERKARSSKQTNVGGSKDFLSSNIINI